MNFVPTSPPPAGPAESSPSATTGVLTDKLVEALTGDSATLSSEAKAAVLTAAPMLRAWLKDIEAEALKEALRGAPPPGFKVVEGRGSRGWDLPDDALLKKLKNLNRLDEEGKTAGRLKKDDYLIEKVVSPAQAETRIKPVVTSRVWENVEKLITRTPGAPTLAPESDTRPALRLNVDEALDDPLPDPTNAAVREEEPPPSFLE